MSQIKANRLARSSGKDNIYPKFRQINGDHPLKHAVPNSYVGYSARLRKGGEVYYFNFELAREMGLIPKSHDDKLTPKLKKSILDTFSIQIINEHDILNNTKIDPNTILPNQYMATRYLQLQHPNKTGLTSGDGRSLWNGYVKGPTATWDVSSCGTGATRLSPATAIEKTFYKTGDKNVSYGCGLAQTAEGFAAALMSDILYKNGLPTERTLAVIRYPDSTSINIRASKNLLRPAHFFGFMKRGDRESLHNIIEYFIDREITNGHLVTKKTKSAKYEAFLEYITNNFAHASALFEGEYIFCWMDWDGDNILTDGGIIDYGTIRQFGLFHHEYRYEDVDKMSTSITEQKNKARYIVQTYAQIIDFLLTGERKPIGDFKSHPVVKRFDEKFDDSFLRHLLYRMGLTTTQSEKLLASDKGYLLTKRFRTQLRYYEKAVAARKAYRVADGIMRDAIFCVRDILRELPVQLLEKDALFTPNEFITIISSQYASSRDLAIYRRDENRIKRFQKTYNAIMDLVAKQTSSNTSQILETVKHRSSLINRYEKMTGDALIYIVSRMTRKSMKLNFNQRYQLMQSFISDQVLDPDERLSDKTRPTPRGEKMKKLYEWIFKTMKANREGI